MAINLSFAEEYGFDQFGIPLAEELTIVAQLVATDVHWFVGIERHDRALQTKEISEITSVYTEIIYVGGCDRQVVGGAATDLRNQDLEPAFSIVFIDIPSM